MTSRSRQVIEECQGFLSAITEGGHRAVAILFDQAGARDRNHHLGFGHVDQDFACFDHTLRSAFAKVGGGCWRIAGTEWLALSRDSDPAGLAQALVSAYAEMTPFSVTWRFEARRPGEEARNAQVTGAGVIERAVRCGMRALQPGADLEAHVEAMRDRLWRLPLNAPTWLEEGEATAGEKHRPFVRLDALSELRCPFCLSPVLPHEEAIDRASRGLAFHPPVGPLWPGDPPVQCKGCPALIEAEDPW